MSTFRLSVYALTLCMLISSAEAFGRKKERHGKSAAGTETTMDPDAMPSKAVQERTVSAAAALHTRSHKANINARYREGIDVSHYQGTIDWGKVVKGANISYAYLKATEGQSYVDDTYAYNLAEARRAGLSVGSYHFYRPNVSPRDQFENMVSNIKPEEQDLAPIIDIEHRGSVSEDRFISDLKELIALVEQYYGCKPLLYSYQNFYNRHFSGLFKGYHWMIAKYQDEEPVLSDGRDYIMWQYTSKGRIDGIRGNVDRSCLMSNFSLSQVSM